MAATSVLARGAGAGAVRRFVEEREGELGHLRWYLPHVEAYRDEELQHVGQTAYLDYAGAALYSRAQVQAASAALLEGLLANPHTSPATEELVARARRAALALFGASEETHTLVFTAGTTHALELLGENFAWEAGGVFLYAGESHTSVLGLRQFARRAGAACGRFALEALPQLQSGLKAAVPLGVEEGAWPAEASQGGRGPRLLAVPGESNFSGARAELGCVASLRGGPLRWRVLLDAAKLACAPGALDLTACPADFAVVSFYKIFGYPTGLGALIVRHDAAALLTPRGSLGVGGPSGAFGPAYFAGGCVASVSASSDFAVPRPGLAEWLERGTSHFQGIAALPSQLAAVRAVAPDGLRRRHAEAVCREAYLRMRGLRHRNGRLLCSIFGRHGEARWWEVQGPTIAALLHYADGSPVPYGLVRERAAARDILLRTGCHCNAGGCQRHLGLSDADLRHFFASGKVCGDDLGVIEGRATGVVRISFGLYSTLADVGRWLALLKEDFLDRAPEVPVECPMCEAPSRPTHVAVPEAEEQRWEEPIPDPAPQLPPVPEPAAPEVASPPAGCAAGGGRVVGLKVYPIKGCGPLVVRRWPLDPATGALFLDRRWCVAPVGRPSTQRVRPVSAKQAPRLTQVRLSLQPAAEGAEEGRGAPSLVLSAKGREGRLVLPLSVSDAELLRRSGAEAEACCGAEELVAGGQLSGGEAVSEAGEADGNEEAVASRAARWFEALLEVPGLRLVAAGAAPGTGEAPAHSHFANAPSTLLLVSTASLRAFGRLCGLAVPAQRFRANLEVDFEVPFEEDSWPVGRPLAVGPAGFEAAGRCVRCQAVDVDPEDPAASGPSLLAALATTQTGGPGGKGPTFGVLLRPRGRAARAGGSLEVLSLGMTVRALADGSQACAGEGDV